VKAFADEARSLMQAIGRPVRLMEVCGTHTVAIFRAGLRSLFPEGLHLLSGPGCPVCVTPVAYVDQAIALAETGAGIATFGDLVRVPGSRQSLEQARAEGGNIKVVYSPLDALAWAAENPQTPVVFLGVGFETTALRWPSHSRLPARSGCIISGCCPGTKPCPAPWPPCLAWAKSRSTDSFALAT